MSKLKADFKKVQAETIHKNIVSRGVYYNCRTDREFGAKLNMSPNTFRNRRQNPKKWTVEEMAMVCEVFHCSFDWLVKDHTREDKDISKN